MAGVIIPGAGRRPVSFVSLAWATSVVVSVVVSVAASGSAVAGERFVYSMGAAGSVRMTGAYMHFPELDLPLPPADDGLGGSVVRLMLDGGLGRFLDYELNAFGDLARGSAMGGSFGTAGAVAGPYRSRYLEWDYWDEGAVDGSLGLDRANLLFLAEPYEVQIGRFPINYSVTAIFAPNDFFAPFSTTAINKIYKPGVDAVHLGVAPGPLSTWSVDAVMGHDTDDDTPSWSHSALLLRASTVRWNVEWAAMGGKLAQRWVIGGTTQGQLGPVGFRAEGHAGVRDGSRERSTDGPGGAEGAEGAEDSVHGRVVGGLDLPLSWRGAMAGVEYMYVSQGAFVPDDYLARMSTFFPEEQPFAGRHYGGATFGLELTPLLRGGVMALGNLADGSGLLAANLAYSVADEADFAMGMFVPWGKRPTGNGGGPDTRPRLRSEFGGMPVVMYLETRFFF
ncbi:MAG: hypothetical protein V3V08_13055 [Nannocystaceae bacterium]